MAKRENRISNPSILVTEVCDRGGIFVSMERLARTKVRLTLRCPFVDSEGRVCGDLFETTLRSWDSSIRKGGNPIHCIRCSYIHRGLNRRKGDSFEEAQAKLRGRGLTLLSSEIETQKTKVRVLCRAGHEYCVSYRRALSGETGCPVCYDIRRRRGELRREVVDLELLQQKATLAGGEVLGEEHRKGKRWLLLRCHAVGSDGVACEKEFARLWEDVKNPKTKHPFICRRCAYVASRRSNKAGLLHGGYKAGIPLSHRYQSRAMRGGQHKAWAKAVRALHGGKCAISGSYGKNQVHHIEPWEKHPELRFDLGNGVPLTLDLHRDFHYVEEPRLGLKRGQAGAAVFLPWFEAKAGFAYVPLFPGLRVEMIFPNGMSGSDLVRRKLELWEQGRLYIPVYPYECRTQLPILASMLRNRSVASPHRVGARSLSLERLDASQARMWFDQNHIQGYTAAGHAYSLRQGDKILAAALFSRNRTPNGRYPDSHELIRFASALNTTVVGGASRLLTHFIREVRPRRLVTFADRRFCAVAPEATMYPNLGFSFSHTIAPSYYYTDANGEMLLNKKRFQRKHLPGRLGDNFDESLSERENMERAGYLRLYDCGRFAYVMDLT